MRFGLNGFGRPLTLEEAGKELGLTRERIRQRQEKTLEKLRRRFGSALKELFEE